MSQPPKFLDKIVDTVLAYHPKRAKKKAARKRKKRKPNAQQR